MFNKNIQTKKIITAFIIFLCVLINAEEEWNAIMRKVAERMSKETMSCYETKTFRNGTKRKHLILQERQNDGTVFRSEERTDSKGRVKNREKLTSTDVIQKAFYLQNGIYNFLIHKEYSVGMLRVGEHIILAFPFIFTEISGKEIEYKEEPCWEITEKLIDYRGEEKYIIIVSQETFLAYKVSKITEDGKLFSITEYSDFNFSPVIEEDAFVIPSDAKITKVNTPREAALTWEEIILKDAHETINVVGKEIKPQTSRWTSFWRKVKRNPSPYIIGVALVLAGISFGTAALLKRREKKQ